jgi:alpha-L-fucosidase
MLYKEYHNQTCAAMKKKDSLFLFLFALIFSVSQAQTLQPTWASLDGRPSPKWFSEAKFGIFVHWGIYSVPAYRPFENNKPKEGTYAEWYAPDVMYMPFRNDSFHIKNYGRNFAYRDFAKYFKAELWNPDGWAKLFKESGAKYVILTSKHHDGFCLWPTKEKYSKGWNAGETGPKRDLVGELTKSVREQGLRMGLYYSWLEWETTTTNSWPANEKLRTGYYIPKEIWEKYNIPYAAFIQHLHFQIKELVNTYKPDIFWTDGAWDHDEYYWKSKEILSWMFNNAPNKDELAVNDRWTNTKEKHGGYYSTEYGNGAESLRNGHPWEECQGMGYSFGYNRAENIDDYKTSKELIHLLIKTVARGGNFLLNIGPAADGTIPVIMQERLKDIGEWLKINGEAIYGTRPFENKMKLIFSCDTTFETYITQKDQAIYLIFPGRIPESIQISNLNNQSDLAISLLGKIDKLNYELKNNKISIILPLDTINHGVSNNGTVLKIEGIGE